MISALLLYVQTMGLNGYHSDRDHPQTVIKIHLFMYKNPTESKYGLVLETSLLSLLQITARTSR